MMVYTAHRIAIKVESIVYTHFVPLKRRCAEFDHRAGFICRSPESEESLTRCHDIHSKVVKKKKDVESILFRLLFVCSSVNVPLSGNRSYLFTCPRGYEIFMRR